MTRMIFRHDELSLALPCTSCLQELVEVTHAVAGRPVPGLSRLAGFIRHGTLELSA